jgi:putative transposase
MKITLQIQILPDATQADRLKAIMGRLNETANWVVGELFAGKVTNKITAQKLFYKDVRDRFGLGAQTAILCIHRAVEAYTRDTTILPVFRPDAAITYDVRTLSFNSPAKVSMLTLSGQIVVPFLMGGYQAERIGYPKGRSDLILRHDGKWFLLVTVDVPDGTEVPTTDFIGIDLGVAKIATDSDGGQMSGEKVEKARRKYGDRRKTLQEAATKRKRSGRRPRRSVANWPRTRSERHATRGT